MKIECFQWQNIVFYQFSLKKSHPNLLDLIGVFYGYKSDKKN